jgi:hypothetical protein
MTGGADHVPEDAANRGGSLLGRVARGRVSSDRPGGERQADFSFECH